MAFPRLWAPAGETPCLFIDDCKVSKILEQLHFLGCVGGTACPDSVLRWGHCGLTTLQGSTCCTHPATATWVIRGRIRYLLRSPTTQARGMQWVLESAHLCHGASCAKRFLPSWLITEVGCAGEREGAPCLRLQVAQVARDGGLAPEGSFISQINPVLTVTPININGKI